MTATRTELVDAFDQLLTPERFKDYGPNGLQVEGRAEIRRIVSGVTASLALIQAAIAQNADAIVVHHGLFWRGQSGAVTGWMKQRLAALLKQDVNLLAYHLPLDAHPEVGNNAQLALRLGLRTTAQLGDQDLIFLGEPEPAHGPRTVADLGERIAHELGRTPQVVGPDLVAPLRRVAWCTGGAQGYFEQAIAAGADAYITGEISEPQAHYAREMGVAYFAAGHHATERYGVAAACAKVAQALGLEHQFIDVPNPA